MRKPDTLQASEDNASESDSGDRSSVIKKLSVYGDFWTRIQDAGVRQCPFFIEPILVAIYTVFFFILCPGTRNPVIRNLAVLFPDSSRIANTFRAFRMFWSFANSITDAARCREEENIIDWEIEGDEHFQSFTTDQGGAIVITAHMGNYDVAAPMFASKFGKKLNAVCAPERDPVRQEYMQKKFLAEATDDYEVRYNSDDKLLGIDLARALMRGEYVAVQGDRVLFDVSPLKVPVVDLPGFHMNIPKGPFVLALTSKATMLPLFAVRLGRRRYRIIVLPSFQCERKSRDHDQAIEEAASQWVEILLPVIRQYWFQWFVFEQAFYGKKLEPSPVVAGRDSLSKAKTTYKLEIRMSDSSTIPEPGSRSYTALFVLLEMVAGKLRLALGKSGVVIDYPVNRPGQNSVECYTLAVLAFILVAGFFTVTIGEFMGSQAWSLTLALLLAFVAFHIQFFGFAFIYHRLQAIYLFPPSAPEQLPAGFYLNFFTLFALGLVFTGCFALIVIAIPWLLWAGINFIAATILFNGRIYCIAQRGYGMNYQRTVFHQCARRLSIDRYRAVVCG